MNLIIFSLKNAASKWWRSLTLGFFILSVSLVMVISGSFILAIKNKINNVIVNGITGRIQIRSNDSMEGDMAEQYNKAWDTIKSLQSSTIRKITGILKKQFPRITYRTLVRRSAYLTIPGKREETMLIGIEPDWKTYRKAFILKTGRYLDPVGRDEILLTEEQAKSFSVKPGDSIHITTKNEYGLNSGLDMKVVGIGNYVMLSLFSYKANYVPGASVRKLAAFNDYEATDLILNSPETDNENSEILKLSRAFHQAGIDNVITANVKLTSDDLKVKSFDYLEGNKQPEKVKLSSHLEMGETFKSVGDTLFTTLNILVFLIMIIIGILIFNLVYLMGIERCRETGTLRAIGFSRNQAIGIFMGEILAIAFLSSIIGVLLSVALVLFLSRTGVPSPVPAMDFIMGKTLYPQIDWGQILWIMIVMTGFAAAASFYPAYQAASVDPARTIQSV